jgi:hypothetical protein
MRWICIALTPFLEPISSCAAAIRLYGGDVAALVQRFTAGVALIQAGANATRLLREPDSAGIYLL